MRRIAKIAFAAALAVAAAQAVRWLAERDGQLAGEAVESAGVTLSSNGSSPANSSGPTRDELYAEARRLEIEGRSKMNKQELKQAVEAAKTGGST